MTRRSCAIAASSTTPSPPAAGDAAAARGRRVFGDGASDVINTLFQGNHADKWGGGLNFGWETNIVEIMLANCQFVDNDAPESGGGLYIRAQGTVNLTNCLLNYNRATSTSASNGGGIWSVGATVNLINCTVVHCSCAAENSEGGGWAAYPGPAGAVTNCVFFDNWADIAKDIGDGVGLAVSFSAMQEAPTGSGNYHDNIIFTGSESPNFVDNTHTTPSDPPTLNNYRLNCPSVCVNAGNSSATADDTQDVDEDNDEEEAAPDLDRIVRHIGYPAEYVDMGAYESKLISPCTTPQEGDTAPLPCTNGKVNIDDFLVVIFHWGSCPTGSSFCPGDVAYHWGEVNIDDLLVVIMNWSEQCQSGTYNAGSFSSVEDCEDAATNEAALEPYSQEWNEWVATCVDALCAAEILDCD